MRWVGELSLFFRQARRVGVYIRGVEAGLTSEQARAYSDALHPPTIADLEFEATTRNRKPLLPWGSALALLLSIWNVNYISNAALAETGAMPPAVQLLGFGIGGLGGMIFLFGLCVGRFIIFDLYSRRTTFLVAVLLWTIGTVLINFEAFST